MSDDKSSPLGRSFKNNDGFHLHQGCLALELIMELRQVLSGPKLLS